MELVKKKLSFVVLLLLVDQVFWGPRRAALDFAVSYAAATFGLQEKNALLLTAAGAAF